MAVSGLSAVVTVHLPVCCVAGRSFVRHSRVSNRSVGTFYDIRVPPDECRSGGLLLRVGGSGVRSEE